MEKTVRQVEGLSVIKESALSPEAKRFAIVVRDIGGTQQAVADIFNITQSMLSQILTGKKGISLAITKVIVFKLGYSIEWFMFGTGKKKAKLQDPKLVTEISMLRSEINLMLNKQEAMEERMKYYETITDKLMPLLSKIPG